MILYSNIDKKFWFHQPNLTRWRHRWRGPRESLKINQEMSSTYYDLLRVNKRREDVDTSLDEVKQHLSYGWDMDDAIDYDWSTDATPFAAPAELMGLEEMSIRIEKLRSRIRNLEI